MTSAGKWVLGLLLLVVGAVFVARTVSSDPGSQAQVKLPSAENAGADKAKSDEEKAKAAAEAAAKKVASTVAGDLACKKACVEVNEVANDAVTTAKLAPGSVTLSKLAFEVPNLNELENEINARKATEAALKSAQAEAAAAAAKNDAAITAAASNGITAEAAARAAADDALGKQLAAGDAALLGSLNKEMADRAAADDVLQGKLNTEIADRAGEMKNLRGELANPVQVGAPILAVNNNEIVGNAVTTDKILDRTILAQDLAVGAVTTTEILNGTILAEDFANGSIVGGTGGSIKDESITDADLAADSVGASEIKTGAVNSAEIADRQVKNIDIGIGEVTGGTTDAAGGTATGSIAVKTITAGNLADHAITTRTLDAKAVTSGKIGDGEVKNINLGSNSVTTDKIDAGAVENSDIAADAVTTDKIETGAVRNSDIGIGQVSGGTDDPAGGTPTGSLAARTVTAGNLANSAVVNRTLAEGAVTSDKISNDTILGEDLETGFRNSLATDAEVASAITTHKSQLSTSAPGSKQVHVDNIDGIDADAAKHGKAKDLDCSVPTGCVDATDLETDAVIEAKIKDEAVTNSKIKTVDGAKVTGNLTTARIDFGNIDGVVIDSTMLAAGAIEGGAGGAIKDGTITAEDLAGVDDADPLTPGAQGVVAGAVTTEKILDLTIQARDLAPDSVDSTKIGNGEVTTDDLRDGAVTSNKVTTNISLASDASPLGAPISGVDVPVVAADPLKIDDSVGHQVLVNAHAQLTCLCGAGDSAVIEYQVVRIEGGGSETAASPVYEVTLADPNPISLPVSVSIIDPDVPAGKYEYKLRFDQTGGAGALSPPTRAVVSAVDLGR